MTAILPVKIETRNSTLQVHLMRVMERSTACL